MSLINAIIGTLLFIWLIHDIWFDSSSVYGRSTLRRPSIETEDKARDVAQLPVHPDQTLPMWCAECSNVVVKTPDGRQHGHRTMQCSRTKVHALPETAEIMPAANEPQTVAELIESPDQELNSWLTRYAGTDQLHPDDLELFRQQLQLVREMD